MTQTRRIILNAVATYARSLFRLACGLFTGRWLLMTLGATDYGLMGVVGGLTAFVTFLNEMLASAVGRFYAYAVGAAKIPGNEETGLDECRKWFNTAVTIHTLIPIVLIVIGYPLGEWAVRYFLNIPVNRVESCVWVWRFVCISCFIAMVNVPYQAMYTAKQNIAELTIYSFFTTTLNVVVLYYMVNHPSDWLATYSAWMMLTSIIPQIIIGIRAHFIYPECRIMIRYLFLWDHVKSIVTFSSVRLLNVISIMFSHQGVSILVNKLLGPERNAAMTVGNTLASHSMTLSGSCSGAFWPAITNAAGERKMDLMRDLAFRCGKFSTIATLIFMIPLVSVADDVLTLWLKTPPTFASQLCVCVIISALLEQITDGHSIAVFAIGKIAEYQIVVSVCGFVTVAVAWSLLVLHSDIIGVGIALICGKGLGAAIRLYYARKVACFKIRPWIKEVFFPVTLIAIISILLSWLSSRLIEIRIFRICLTTVVAESVFLPACWVWALSREEQTFVAARLKPMLRKFGVKTT